MRLAVFLMAIGTALMALGLLVITTGGPCLRADCGPSINEVGFWSGAAVFALGFLRGAYVAVRTSSHPAQLFMVTVGAIAVVAAAKLLVT